MPDFKDVTSTNISAVAYESESKKLYVRFKSGGVYSYEGVPEEVHKDFMLSESKGKFFGSSIKGKYNFKKEDLSGKDNKPVGQA